MSLCLFHVFFFNMATNSPCVNLEQEFVHGDLGRTRPSMRSLLKGQAGQLRKREMNAAFRSCAYTGS